MRLNGKVAIVTGSAQGIGRAIAMRLASEGATIVVNDINMEKANQAADEIKGQGGTAIAFKADVTNRAEVQNLMKNTMEKFKAIHILVNNAGIIRHRPFPEMTEEDWDAVLDVDLKGVFNCSQAVLGYMMPQRYGKIINIASVAGTGCGVVNGANYAAAKGGVIQLTKVTAKQAGPYNINVNAIAPGIVVTELLFTGRSKEEVENVLEWRKKSAVLGRLGKPEDIANLALFLASDESNFVTGQVICCDGGRTDHM